MEHLIRLGKLPIENVMPFVINVNDRNCAHGNQYDYFIVRDELHRVKMNGMRLRTFLHSGTTCVYCGLTGEYFALEQAPDCPDKPHFGLYGCDALENEIRFTHDHKVARALGGPDHISNTQTLCTTCNTTKSGWESRICNARKMKRDAAEFINELTNFQERINSRCLSPTMTALKLAI